MGSVHADRQRRSQPGHPGQEVGYIIAGTVGMQIADSATLTRNAGDPFLIPPGIPHNALDLGPGVGHMLSAYIVEADQPLVTLVDAPDEAEERE